MEKCFVVLFIMIDTLRLRYITMAIIVLFAICGGDIIHFVENLFSLSFKEAMQKINIDFGLGLDNYNVNYNKLNYIKNVQNEKKKKKQELTKKYCELCDTKLKHENVIDLLNKKINVNNWETIISLTSNYDTRLCMINEEIEEIDNKLSSRT